MTWVIVLSVAAVCFALRIGAPLALRTRSLPTGLANRLNAVVPALLAALLATQLFVVRQGLTVDWRTLGASLGGFAYLWRRSLPISIAVAALVTALARSI